MRVLVGLVIAALLTSAAACVRDGAPPVVPVDVAVTDVGDAGRAPIVQGTAPNGSRDRCTARLSPQPIETGEGCTLDERISKGSGTLLYPCSGSGAVEAVFAEHRFEGVITNGSILLNLTTEIDWEDGCHWQTKQRIRGELHSQESTLAWTYSEAPVSGSSCYGSCKATAEITVEDPGAPSN
jgi:hypothetical protein